MIKRTDQQIWCGTDYKGRRVSLYEKERDHIISSHSVMDDQFHVVYATIEAPDSVFASSYNPQREVHVSKNCGFKYPHLYIRAIVEYDEIEGKIVTAYPNRQEEGGTGAKLYQKDEI